MKNKIDVDQLAMILADFEHGEITTCKGFECKTCPLGKDTTFIVKNKKLDICDMLIHISNLLSEVEE